MRRKFYETFHSQQKNAWERREDLSELRDKVVLVAGLGHIGSQVARLANCFGAHVIAIDNGGIAKPDFVEELERGEYLEDALPRADFVVSCLPYTRETHHLFGLDKFKKMKPTAVFINIGRGGVVNEADLVQALRDKTISGAGLDVTETEPLPSENPLWSMENVVITPHHSGLSDKYIERAIDRFCLNLKAYLAGEKLPNLIDKERGY